VEGVKEKTLLALRQTGGDFLSGEDLSRLLGVSRTAVWKAVQALREEGYTISSRPRRGYRLEQVPNLLLPAEIRWGLETWWLGHKIYYRDTLASTNELAKELARQGEEEGTLVIAEEQVAGRGRRGRSWHSPRGQNLLFSLLLRPPLQPAQTPQLTFLAAVALAEILKEELGLAAGIKWPNDVYVGGRKVAGILTELSAEVDRVNFVIMGIGINVNTPLDDFPLPLQDRATSLQAEVGRALSRVDLLQKLLLRIENWYKAFLRDGFAPLRRRWKELALVLGKGVQVIGPDETLSGVAVDVDDFGALLVQVPEGPVRRVLAGDVSLREAVDNGQLTMDN
jgi:BirA family biotin operon repressor/biotin-[acetyl-CoA-carboxylase] ligase